MTTGAQRAVQLVLNVLVVIAAFLVGENWRSTIPTFAPYVFTAIGGLSAVFAALAWYAVTQLDKLGQDIDSFGFGATARPFAYVHARRNRALYAGIACALALAANGAVAAIMGGNLRTSEIYSTAFVFGCVATSVAFLGAIRIVTVHRKLQTFRRDLLSRLQAQKKAIDVINNMRASDILQDVSKAASVVVLPRPH